MLPCYYFKLKPSGLRNIEHLGTFILYSIEISKKKDEKKYAPSEDRTHDLEIMRLARCLLRYRGLGNEPQLL